MTRRSVLKGKPVLQAAFSPVEWPKKSGGKVRLECNVKLAELIPPSRHGPRFEAPSPPRGLFMFSTSHPHRLGSPSWGWLVDGSWMTCRFCLGQNRHKHFPRVVSAGAVDMVALDAGQMKHVDACLPAYILSVN